MLQIIKELILDAQKGKAFDGTKRHLTISSLPHKATIIIGVRRCGKTTFLNQVLSDLQSEGIPKENFLLINLFDDRLAQLQTGGLDPVTEAYYQLYPEKKGKEKVFFFLDEIHAIPGWEHFVDRILRTENCAVYLSGSSARMLSKEIATQMRGRGLSWELFPFSFGEFLDAGKITSHGLFDTKQRLHVQKAFTAYWEQGGFPEVYGIEPGLRVKIHQEYFHSILFRDLIERYDIAHPRAVLDLARHLTGNIASMYTINKLTGFLKSLGHKAPKESVSDYLEWFEDAFFLYTVRMFDASYTRSNANSKKIYCVDHALVTSVSSRILVNSGHLLENIVFMTLRRRFPDIWYYKTAGGREVDFIFQQEDRTWRLFQACESLKNPATRQREITALQEAMTELRLSHAILVTRDEQEEISVSSGIIEVVPVWRFLLDNETGG
jgi:predicted AAA+ superfamily ATPase